MELKQFDINFDRFHYIIEDSGIRLIKRRLAESSDTFVDFEDIGSKIIKENTRKLIWLIISTLFLVIGTVVLTSRMQGKKIGNNAEIFHYSVSLIFFSVFLLTRRNVLFLTQSDNTNAIEFLAAKRYKERVDQFIKTLLQSRDRYLIEKYSQPDEFLPYQQQYNNLVWLYSLKLLSKEQLREKVADLDKFDLQFDSGKKNNLVKIVGFKRSDSRASKEESQEDE
jgi:hypothetical protein